MEGVIVLGLPQYADLFYWLILLGAFGVCMTLATRRMKPILPVGASAAPLLLCTFIGGLIGAKLLWLIEYAPPLSAGHWSELAIWKGGMVSCGGFAGGILGIGGYAGLTRISFRGILDAAAPCVALGEAVSRMGCFLAGCCWGSVTNVPWSVRFPGGSQAFAAQAHLGMISLDTPESLPVHPTQLYMLAGLLVVTALLLLFDRRKRAHGQTVCAYLVFYGILRFIVEIFRAAARGGDSSRVVAEYLTVAQVISLGCIAFGLAGLYLLSLRLCRATMPSQGRATRDVSVCEARRAATQQSYRRESVELSANADVSGTETK